MRVSRQQLTESEYRTRALVYAALYRTFIGSEKIEVGTTTKSKSTTTLKLPIDSEGTPIADPVKSAPILVKLQRLSPGTIQAEIIRGSELLPEGKLPLAFTQGLKRVNGIIKTQNQEGPLMHTVDPDDLDRLASEKN